MSRSRPLCRWVRIILVRREGPSAGPPEPSEDPEVTRGLQPSPDDLVLHVYFCSCRKNFKRTFVQAVTNTLSKPLALGRPVVTMWGWAESLAPTRLPWAWGRCGGKPPKATGEGEPLRLATGWLPPSPPWPCPSPQVDTTSPPCQPGQARGSPRWTRDSAGSVPPSLCHIQAIQKRGDPRP